MVGRAFEILVAGRACRDDWSSFVEPVQAVKPGLDKLDQWIEPLDQPGLDKRDRRLAYNSVRVGAYAPALLTVVDEVLMARSTAGMRSTNRASRRAARASAPPR